MSNKQSEKINIRNELLDKYEQSIGIPKHEIPGQESELQEYLSMNRQQIKKLSASDCTEISIRLAQYAFYIQRQSNRENSNKIWAENELNSLISKEVGQYDKFMKHEVKVQNICRQSEAARELQKILVWAEQRSTRLSYLSSSILSLKDAIKDAYYVKIKEEKQ